MMLDYSIFFQSISEYSGLCRKFSEQQVVYIFFKRNIFKKFSLIL